LIKIQVRAVGLLVRVLCAKEFDVSLPAGATAETLLRALLARYGEELAKWTTNSEGQIENQHVRILVNGKELFMLRGVDSVLAEGDVVSMIPVVGGG